jgi:hypothetical protein
LEQQSWSFWVAENIIKESLARSIRMIMLVAAALALAGVASSALLPQLPKDRPS